MPDKPDYLADAQRLIDYVEGLKTEKQDLAEAVNIYEGGR
nr:MAG TPA: hypothetical protein [Caudoviricetes sp.]